MLGIGEGCKRPLASIKYTFVYESLRQDFTIIVLSPFWRRIIKKKHVRDRVAAFSVFLTVIVKLLQSR
jgi:hypothetical protein